MHSPAISIRPTLLGQFAALALGAASLAGCAGSPSTLDAKGTGAADIGNLWWWSFGLGALITIAVVGLILVKLFWPNDSARGVIPGQPGSDKWIVIGGVAIPAVVLIALLLPSLFILNSSSASPGGQELVIQVTGHQWWWEARYPAQQVTTANEIHIPTGRPVHIDLEAVDVIHSFWVPQLHGKIDVFPNRPTSITLEATAVGPYRGECAEFCGINHANMGFRVFADSPAQFDTWLKNQEQPGAPPKDVQPQKGQQVFLSGKCVECHTIRGTPAAGKEGPDLTHFGSRTTFAANTYPNTPGFLGGWIIDPQSLKPENKMPPNSMTGADLQALLAYLYSLQ